MSKTHISSSKKLDLFPYGNVYYVYCKNKQFCAEQFCSIAFEIRDNKLQTLTEGTKLFPFLQSLL